MSTTPYLDAWMEKRAAAPDRAARELMDEQLWESIAEWMARGGKIKQMPTRHAEGVTIAPGRIYPRGSAKDGRVYNGPPGYPTQEANWYEMPPRGQR